MATESTRGAVCAMFGHPTPSLTRRRALRALPVLLAVAGVALLWIGLLGRTSEPAPVQAAAIGLHVAGNRILNSSGQPVRLLGVNRSGAEYACVEGWGFFDGPT